MIPEDLKEWVTPLLVISGLVTVVTILVRLLVKAYKDSRTDKEAQKKEQQVLLAEERVKRAEQQVKKSEELYEKFIEEYKDLSKTILENNNLLIDTIKDNKVALNSMETTLSQNTKINEKLSNSVDNLRDTLTKKLIDITT